MDGPAEAEHQHLTATVSLPGTWNDGKWCSAAVCVFPVTLRAVSKEKLKRDAFWG